MNNLMSRISEEIELKAMRQNIIGAKIVRTTLYNVTVYRLNKITFI